jgi:hypothetical protein
MFPSVLQFCFPRSKIQEGEGTDAWFPGLPPPVSIHDPILNMQNNTLLEY